MTCPACGSEHVKTIHTDRCIEIRCKDCQTVSVELYGRHPRQGKSEAEEAIQEARG